MERSRLDGGRCWLLEYCFYGSFSQNQREKKFALKSDIFVLYLSKKMFFYYSNATWRNNFTVFFLDDILFQSQETLERLFAYSILENWRWFTFQSFAPPTRYVLLLVILQITVYNKFTKTCFVERRIRSWSWQAFVLHRLPVHFKIWHILTNSVTHSWPPI